MATHIEIENKKYVLIPEEDYFKLQTKAALKTTPEKMISLREARNLSKKLFKEWATEK